MRWCSLIAGIFVATTPPPARAQPNDASGLYSLSWVRGAGAEDCPAALELRREIERRIGRPLFDASAPQSIEVSVRRDDMVMPPTRRSDIHVRNATGATIGERTLTSSEADCRSLFSSTALAIALLVDPDAAALRDATSQNPALQNASIARRPPSQVAANQSRPVSATATTPPVEVAPSQPQNLTRTHAEPPVQNLAVSPLTPKSERVAQVSVGPVVAIALIPTTELGVFMGLRAWESPQLGWSLSVIYLPHGQSEMRGGTSVAVGLTALLPALMLELLANEHVRLIADLGGALGALPIAVRGAPATGPKERIFLSARAELGMQLKLSSVAQLELACAGLAPLVRTRLNDTSQSESLFVQPSVGAIGRIGIGLQFP